MWAEKASEICAALTSESWGLVQVARQPDTEGSLTAEQVSGVQFYLRATFLTANKSVSFEMVYVDKICDIIVHSSLCWILCMACVWQWLPLHFSQLRGATDRLYSVKFFSSQLVSAVNTAAANRFVKGCLLWQPQSLPGETSKKGSLYSNRYFILCTALAEVRCLFWCCCSTF